jgi:hypothetical protein
LFLCEWRGRHGAQAHVKVRLVKSLMQDVVFVEFLDHAVERGLIGHTYNDARRYGLRMGGETTGGFKSRVVGLNKLLRERNVLPHKDVEVRVNLQVLHTQGAS